VVWLNREQLVAQSVRLRSPLVQNCVDDYLAGRRYPLDLLTYLTPDSLLRGMAQGTQAG
jgi:hypothetical protein